MGADDRWTDANGKPLRMDTRVRCTGDMEAPAGTIVMLSDPDGDVDDEGRSIYLPARVAVRWDDYPNDAPELYDGAMTVDPWVYQFDDLVVEEDNAGR